LFANQEWLRVSRGLTPRSARFACVFWLLCALCACQSRAPARSLSSIEPALIDSDTEVEVTLKGRGFRDVPRVTLSSRAGAELDGAYRVFMVDTADASSVFEALHVTRKPEQDPDQLTFLTRKLARGTYHVRLEPPRGAALTLRDALTVKDAGQIDPEADAAVPAPARSLSIEDAANGEGKPLEAVTLAYGASVELYAVIRESDGSVSTEEVPIAFSALPALGELREVSPGHSTFVATVPGALTVTAVADSVPRLRASVAITIEEDADNTLANMRLTVEDKPGGEGTPLDPDREYVAGALLDVYAVMRNSEGAFKWDVPVTWTVTGAETHAATLGTSLSQPLVHAGVATLRASHERLGDVDVALQIVPGPVERLTIEPESAALRAGDDPQTFEVRGRDSYGNVTADIGTITYTLEDDDIGDFDSKAGTVTPQRIGTAHLVAESSYDLSVTSGDIKVSAGALDRLILSPDTLQLTADDPAVQFEVSGVDAFDNQADVGDLTWTVASGAIGTLSADGELEPEMAGSGTIRVSSSHGVSVDSGQVEITGGRAITLQITPDTWQGVIGGATQTFEVSGSDGDGNLTADLGTLTFATSGAVRAINAQTGVLTPTVAGQGTVTATSSYGASVTTRNILVSSSSATLTVTNVRLPDFFWGATTRVEVDVRSNDVADIVLTGMSLSFTSTSGGDLSSQISYVADNDNLDRIAAGATQTLGFYVTVATNASYQDTVYVTTRGELFNASGNALTVTSTSTGLVRYPWFGTSLTIDAPVPPNEHACAGGRIAFGASVDGSFTYFWRFPEGTFASGSSATSRYPSVDYSTIGSKSYAVSALYTWLGTTYATQLVGKPVFIGAANSVPAEQYPTGRAVFSSPTNNQNVALTSFPRANLIALDPALPLRQCNNVAVAASGRTAVTLFSDRKLIDPASDVDSETPGIQVKLTAQGVLPTIPLLAPPRTIEGPTTIYAEYVDPQSGKVTAAGDATFTLTSDTQVPSVVFSSPASSCSSACLRSRDPVVFQFSEPLSAANVTVDMFAGASSCTGSPTTSWTGSSTVTYDIPESALYVTTPQYAGTYAVRVRLPVTVLDTATPRNALAVTERCVVFASLTAPAVPAAPQLTAAAETVFSPDGDQSAESVTWNVSVDGATTLLRLRILRGNKPIWGKLVPVSQAGQVSVSWDGADPSGRLVNNGAYSYAIEAVNRAGVASATALRGYVEVKSAVRLVSLRRRQ
jgi:hypothetical protein